MDKCKCESRHCLFVLKLWYSNLTSLIRIEIKESKPVFINNSPQAFSIINVHLFSTVFFLHFCCEGENDWQVLLSWATGWPLSSRRQMTGDAPWHDKNDKQNKTEVCCFREILLYKCHEIGYWCKLISIFVGVKPTTLFSRRHWHLMSLV